MLYVYLYIALFPADSHYYSMWDIVCVSAQTFFSFVLQQLKLLRHIHTNQPQPPEQLWPTEARTPQVLWGCSSTVLECGEEYYPAERRHCLQDIQLERRGVRGLMVVWDTDSFSFLKPNPEYNERLTLKVCRCVHTSAHSFVNLNSQRSVCQLRWGNTFDTAALFSSSNTKEERRNSAGCKLDNCFAVTRRVYPKTHQNNSRAFMCLMLYNLRRCSGAFDHIAPSSSADGVCTVVMLKSTFWDFTLHLSSLRG